MQTRLLDSKINNDPKHLATTISVGGMTCAACVARVEKTLRSIEGVSAVSVNYGTEQAEVEYDTKAVNFGHLQSAIIDAGYTAHRPSEFRQKQLEEKEKIHQKESRTYDHTSRVVLPVGVTVSCADIKPSPILGRLAISSSSYFCIAAPICRYECPHLSRHFFGIPIQSVHNNLILDKF